MFFWRFLRKEKHRRTRTVNRTRTVLGSVSRTGSYLICIRLPLQQNLGFADAPLLPVLPGDPVILLRARQNGCSAISTEERTGHTFSTVLNTGVLPPHQQTSHLLSGPSSTDSWWAGLSEEAEPLESPEEVLETVEMVDMRRRVEDRMYGITTEPTRLFFFSVSEHGCDRQVRSQQERGGA